MTGVMLPTTETDQRATTYVQRELVTKDTLTYAPIATAVNVAALTIEATRALVALPSEFMLEFLDNRRLYFGDHWLNGRGWKGPWPQVQPGATADEMEGVRALAIEIMRGFNPRNVIAETNERHATGVVGNEPTWTWTPDGVKVRTPRQLRKPAIALVPPPIEPPPAPTSTDPTAPPPPAPKPKPAPAPAATADSAASDALAAKIDKYNSQITKWWDDRNCHDVFLQYTTAMLYGRVVSLRLHIAPNAIEQEKVNGTATGRRVVKIANVEDALTKIHVEVVDADAGRVVRDRMTLKDYGVRLAKRNEQDIAYLTYLDDNGRTIMAVVDESSGGGPGQKAPAGMSFDLGGRLLMHTSVRETFCTEQVRQGQFALNYANTVIGRNLTTSGFVQRTYGNISVGGTFKTIDGRRTFIPDPMPTGPTVSTVLQGHTLEDADGKSSMTTPIIHDREPVNPAPTIAAKREYYRDILEECDQVHVLISGDAIASGVSRIQARADHISSMKLTKANVERAGRWLIETVTAFAYALANPSANGKDAIAGMRVTFNCVLDAGPIDATERAQNTIDVGAGTLSVETCIERNSITDVDAELDRIDSARMVDLEVKRSAIFAAWVAAGVDEAFAAYRAGLSPDAIERLQHGFTMPAAPPVVDPNANPTGGNPAGGGHPNPTPNANPTPKPAPPGGSGNGTVPASAAA